MTLWDVGGFVAMSIVGIEGAIIAVVNSHFFQKEKGGLLSAPFYIKLCSYTI